MVFHEISIKKNKYFPTPVSDFRVTAIGWTGIFQVSLGLILVKSVLIGCTGGSGKVVKRPAVEPFPQQRQPDISKAKKILHWHPTVNPRVLLCR